MEIKSNAERAGRAAAGVAAYKGWTHPMSDANPTEEWEEALSDLYCDLQHLAQREGIDWATIQHRGDQHHRAEKRFDDAGGDPERPVVFVTCTGGIPETFTTGADVLLVDWDTYEDGNTDCTLEDLTSLLADIEALPDTGEIGAAKRNAKVSALGLIGSYVQRETENAHQA